MVIILPGPSKISTMTFKNFCLYLICNSPQGSFQSTFDSHSDAIFKELELLKLFDIRQLELGKLLTILFCLQSSTIIFSLNKQVHSYATRYANDFHFSFCRTNRREFSVSFQGPTYYNALSNSLHSFKTKLKKIYVNY